MVREVLKIKTDNGLGDKNPTFKDIEITEYSFKSPRMGVPTLTAELLWPTCLDDEWTHKEYVELRGERYYIRQVQSSNVSNTNTVKYKHSLDFKSEREQLSHVYFYDAVPSVIALDNSKGHDKPCTNSTSFKFFGTIHEFADRINCALLYADIGDSILKSKTHLTDADAPAGDGYCCVVSDTGDADLTVTKEFDWSDKWMWEALTEGFDKYGVPFAFHGKKIVFNEKEEALSHVFKQGFDDELLSIKKTNANAKIINRITFKGSEENIPYFYPNETEYGGIVLKQLSDNTNIPLDSFELVNPSKLVSRITSEDTVTLFVDRIYQIDFANFSYKNGKDEKKWSEVASKSWHLLDQDVSGVPQVLYSFDFSIPNTCNVEITGIYGRLWRADHAAPEDGYNAVENLIAKDIVWVESLANEANEVSDKIQWRIDNGSIVMPNLPSGSYSLIFSVKWGRTNETTYWRIDEITSAVTDPGSYYWMAADKKVKDLETLGVRFKKTPDDSMIGGGFRWDAGSRMPFQTNLLPPKYRLTAGKERYYNALNDAYTRPDGSYYTFKNPYIEGDPNEYIYSNDEIKPTIEGVVNANDQLFGTIADIAFDSDDSDSLKATAEDQDDNNAQNYAHSYFYIKLNKFDGDNGFDLFSAASQTNPMTIQMTSGPCDGCKFKIQVAIVKDGDIEVWRNPVQVQHPDGDIASGGYSSKVNADNIQPYQQNTQENSVWICVQKDAETFGVIMPNRTHNYMPAVGDTFNIINIDLPQGYIDAAETRGMYSMLDFMEDNNEEKFTFDISASRIYFAQHKDLLESLSENSIITIEYDGKTYEQYISELAIDCKDNETLPDIKITLVDTLSATGSFVQEVVAQAADASQLRTNKPTTGTTGVDLTTTDARYIRKDGDDSTEYKITSGKAFEVGTFISGSSGGILSIDPVTGKSTLEADYVKARMKAIFDNIEIANVKSIGGKLIISPGGSATISFVEEKENAYRCYFKRKENEQSADCRFTVGDDVYCQSFNVTNGATQEAYDNYYWRTVTAVSNDESYIELSKSSCVVHSGVPQPGDVICQLGSKDASRQSAIVLSTADENSPNITLYDGVTNFTLKDKEVVDMGVDVNTGKAYFHVYGDTYIGDKDGNSFLKYDNLLKLLEIQAKLSVNSTVGTDTLEEYIKKVSPPVTQEDIEGFVNNIIDPKIDDIQNQIDGVIETWFYNGVPTLASYPASAWTSVSLKQRHLGDLYYDNDTGTAYRFSQDAGGNYYWNKITDEAITKALAAAQEAKDVADGKRRVFVAEPTTPYDVGDLWVNAIYPKGTTATTHNPENGKYYNDLLRCQAARLTGPLDIDDWVLASDYTNDDKANEAFNAANKAQEAADNAAAEATEAKDRLNAWAADGVISPSEKQGIKDEIARIDADKAHVDTEYARYELSVNQTFSDIYDQYRSILLELSATEPETIPIPDSFELIQIDYYAARTDALSEIAAAAKAYAQQVAEDEASKAVAGYEYLKKALGDVTSIVGGVMLSSQIRLGEHNDDFTTQTTWSGHNGVYKNGRSIGSWWGGDMVDLFNDSDTRISPEPSRGASALVRMDGSAYFSHGNIGFKKDGSGWLGNDKTGIKFTTDGTMTLGGGIKVSGDDPTGVQQTLADITNFNIGLTRLLKPYDADNNPLTWEQAAESDGAGGIKAKSLRSEITFASYGDVVAFADGSIGSGGSGGSGIDLEALEEYLTTNGYATESWVSAHFNNYELPVATSNTLGGVKIGSGLSINSLGVLSAKEAEPLTKAAVEAVLTGNITTHTHDQYLTEHQSLDGYLTKGVADEIYQNKNESVYFYNYPQYVAARFMNEELMKKAATSYIEFWNSDGWFNFQMGSIVAHGPVTATQFIGSLSGNAATATRLEVAHTFWGQSFDGTNNISGKLSTVTDIEMSGAMTQGGACYGHNGAYTELQSGGNEMVWSCATPTGDMYINYRGSAYNSGYVPKTWRWMAGSGSTWASHEIDSLIAKGSVTLPYAAGSYNSMASRSDLIKGAVSNSDRQAHAIMRLNNSTGAAWIIGGAGKDIGVYGFNVADLTVGNTDPSWRTVWNVDTGELTHTGTVTVKSVKLGGGTITWDEDNNVFVFSHTVVSQGDLVAYKE